MSRHSDRPRQKYSLTNIGSFFLLASFPFLFGACPRNDEPPKAPKSVISVASPSPSLAPIPASFNGERAMDHVRKQMDIGPRPPDTPALVKTRTYIVNELKSYGLQVALEEFTVPTPKGQKKMANIVAEVPGETKNILLITSHYDSKYYNDMHFVGANDPGTSVATLMEIGRVLGSARDKPKLTYRLVFFDGEEAFCEGWDECHNGEDPDHTYGSRHYASQLQSKGELSTVRGLILLDMMGYKELELGRDTMSTKWLQDIIWQTGRDLGHSEIFVDRPEGVGGDDHEPFLRAGIDSVDIIQLNSYPYWHRPDDTIDKVSAQSMKIVGETVLASLPRIADKVVR